MSKIKIDKKYKQQLLARFNSNNAELVNFEYYEINIECILCNVYYNNSCDKCPLKVLESRYKGCMILIDKLSECEHIYICDSSISWDIEDKKEALKELELINKNWSKYIEFV